ncbi:MAG TPA: hypothetical protein VN926_19150, partial [Bradyrhizobium sp.]|nr:hypothetical protein [Bradyrhizobium sp.]
YKTDLGQGASEISENQKLIGALRGGSLIAFEAVVEPIAVRVWRLVRSAIRVHRIPPRARDDRETPLKGDGTADIYN